MSADIPPAHPETPFVLIDEATVDRNLERLQRYCDDLGIRLRPHIKTHKLPLMAEKQIELGAVGLNCQKLSEAEVFVEAGFRDILITYNLIGETRLKRLKALHRQAHISVTADSREVVNRLAEGFDGERPLTVWVECDTGGGRCGVQTPEATLELAGEIDSHPGLLFGGVLTYPASGEIDAVNAWSAAVRAVFDKALRVLPAVSTGGTPDMWQLHRLRGVTEYRCGTYIYNDRSLIEQGTCQLDDCALTVECTVVSRPTEDRVIVDAGSKSLSSDLLGMQGHGLVRNYPQARVRSLSEEHGIIDMSACEARPKIGDRLGIVPNHACVVSNLYDQVWLQTIDGTMRSLTVAARGRVY